MKNYQGFSNETTGQYWKHEKQINGNKKTSGNGITESQISYIKSLAQQAGVTVHDLETMTKSAASGLIDELKRAASGDPHSKQYLARDWSKRITL